jgi:Transposase DDE domain
VADLQDLAEAGVRLWGDDERARIALPSSEDLHRRLICEGDSFMVEKLAITLPPTLDRPGPGLKNETILAQIGPTFGEKVTLEVAAVGQGIEGEEVRSCEAIGVTPYVPKPLTAGAKAQGRFGKQDFVYVAEDDTYRCPAGETLTWRFTSDEAGKMMRSYWTTKCADCRLKAQCTTGKERRIRRWEHEAVIDAMQERLDRTPIGHAHPPRHRRAPLRHPQGLDGRHPLQAENPRKGQNRDEPPRSGLQSQESDRHLRRPAPNGGDPGLRPSSRLRIDNRSKTPRPNSRRTN